MKIRNLKKFLALLGALAASGLPAISAFAALEVFEVRGMGKGLRDSENTRVQPVPPVYSEIVPPGVPGAPWLLKHGGTFTIREPRYGYVSADGKVFVTKPEFSAAEPFVYSPRKNLCAAVCKNGAWNYIDKNGVLVFTSWRADRKTLRADMNLADFYLSFRRKNAADPDPNESQSAYVRNYTTRALKHFVLRGAHEGKANYTTRINSGAIEYESRRRAAEARDAYLARHTPKALTTEEFELEAIDIDSGVAQFSHPIWGNFRVKAGQDAQGARFESAWINRTMQLVEPKFVVRDDVFALERFSLVVDGTKLPVDNTLPFAGNGGTAKSDAEIAQQIAEAAKEDADDQREGGSVVGTRLFSDVDTNVPKLPPRNDGKKHFALVIANEKYDESMGMKDVPFARRDGQVVAQYFRDVLGAKVTERTDLSSGQFASALKDFRNLLATNPGAEGYIYYAGHAVSGEDGIARLLPTDVNTELATRYGVNVAEHYKALGETDASRIVVFFDSCYSGGKKDDDSRGIALAPDETRPAPNMVVLSASTAKQISQPYTEGSHGLFTYFLLKKLQETKGAVSVNELFRYVKENVERVSADNERYRLQTQTPTLLTGSKVSTADLDRALR